MGQTMDKLKQDINWVEFSTLDVGARVYSMQLQS